MPPYKHGDWVVVDPTRRFYGGQHGEVMPVDDPSVDPSRESLVRLPGSKYGVVLENQHLRRRTPEEGAAYEDQQRKEAARERVYQAMREQGSGVPGKSPIPGLGSVVPANVRTGQPAAPQPQAPAPPRTIPPLPEEQHAARFRDLDTSDGAQPQGPVDAEEQEQLPSRLAAEDPRAAFRGVNYDYSHHLPEEWRQKGWQIVGGTHVAPATQNSQNGSDAPFVRLQDESGAHQGGMFAEPTRSGHNFMPEDYASKTLPDDLRDAASSALGQHLALHTSGALRNLQYTPPPAPLDVSDGRPVDPAQLAEPEGPRRISNPYYGKEKTPRTAKLVGHGPAVRDSIFQMPLGTAQAYDYAHHLTPEQRQKGYGMTMYHWPQARQSQAPQTLSTPQSPQMGHSLLSVTQNGQHVGSAHHFESSAESLATRHPIMSAMQGVPDRRLVTAAQAAFKQHRQLAFNRELPTTTLKNRFAGLEIDKVVQQAKKRRAKAASPQQAPGDSRFKWLETDGSNGPVRGEVEQQQAKANAEQATKDAAAAAQAKVETKQQKEAAARQVVEARRGTAPTFLSGSVETDNAYNKKYAVDYSHHLPEKWTGTHQLVVRNTGMGHRPEAVVVRNSDQKVVANRGGDKDYRRWKGVPALQESLIHALRQHKPMFEALTQAKPGDKLTPTKVQPGREMTPQEWQKAKQHPKYDGTTLGAVHNADDWKGYDYTHLMPEHLGGHKLWVHQLQRGDNNLVARVMSPDGQHHTFDPVHTYPNIALDYDARYGHLGGGFAPHVMKALHDHARFIKDNEPQEPVNLSPAGETAQPEEPGPRVLSIGAEGHAMVRYNHHLPETMRDSHRLAVYHNQGQPWASVERRISGRAEATRGLHGRNTGPYQEEMANALAEHASVADQLSTAKQGDILRVPQRGVGDNNSGSSAPPSSTPPAAAPATPAAAEAAPAQPSRFSLLETDGPRPAPPAAKPSFAPSSTQQLAPAPKTTFNSRWEALELSEKTNLGITMMKKEAAIWMGRPLVSHKHVADLERTAAINEFGKRIPKSQAERQAYEDYVKDQRTGAAAWHLKGLKAAQAAGDRDAAEKHAMMYALHCKALGFEPNGSAPHPSIMARTTDGPDEQSLYRFRAHRGDLYALPDGNKGAQDPTSADK